jgi:hypothetical protein
MVSSLSIFERRKKKKKMREEEKDIKKKEERGNPLSRPGLSPRRQPQAPSAASSCSEWRALGLLR